MKFQSISQSFFLKVGTIILSLLLGIIISVVALHLLGLING
ncbi:hypothetical protein [Okeania sp. SIO2C9]|nr:hypothetical protein [Okeania sp. SIO2C9]